MRRATVLHADLDAFFASVEQRDDPALRGRPVIVGSWVVMAASYEARAHGVRGAMSGARARSLCPDAVVVEPRFRAYVEASRQVFAVFDDISPVVEALSIDEAFLDVRGMERLAGSATDIARRLRREVRDRVGLPITVGVASTKSLAKIASAMAKPDGMMVVDPVREIAFLHALPVERLWGVGPATAERLRAAGIATVGQIARMGPDAAGSVVGRHMGAHLVALARNRDPRPVRAGRGRRSFGAQSALGTAPRTDADLDAVLLALVERVTRRMRRADAVGRTVTLRLRFGDYASITRSRTLAIATAQTDTLLVPLRALLHEARPEIARRGITLLGVAVANLDGRERGQLALPMHAGRDDLDTAVDLVRDRFGGRMVTRASLLGRGGRDQTWLLPGEDLDD